MDPVSDDTTTLIEWVVAGVVAIAGLVAAVGKRAKRLIVGDPPDYEAMARAFFTVKAEEDRGHREHIEQAFDRAIEKLSVQMNATLERIHHETAAMIVTELRNVRDEYASIKSDTRLLIALREKQ